MSSLLPRQLLHGEIKVLGNLSREDLNGTLVSIDLRSIEDNTDNRYYCTKLSDDNSGGTPKGMVIKYVNLLSPCKPD